MIPLFKSRVAVFAIGALLVGASVAYAQVWTPPTDNFPNGNVSVPLTVGTSTQWKNGTLYVNQLRVSPTSSPAGAITFPYNKGIVGYNGTRGATQIIPYAGPTWGLYLNSDTGAAGVAGSGVISIRSSNNNGTGNTNSSMIRLYPDGRITTLGTFVLPTTATTSARAVAGALVYSGGTAYMYSGVTNTWNPVGSGTGGGGIWALDSASQGILYSDVTNPNVKIATTLKNVTLSLDGTLNVSKVPATWPTGWYYEAGSTVNAGANAGVSVTIDDFKNAYPTEFGGYATLADVPRINFSGSNTDATTACRDTNPSNSGVVNAGVTTAECEGAPYGAVLGASSKPTLYDLRVWIDAGSYIVGYKKFILTQDLSLIRI